MKKILLTILLCFCANARAADAANFDEIAQAKAKRKQQIAEIKKNLDKSRNQIAGWTAQDATRATSATTLLKKVTH